MLHSEHLVRFYGGAITPTAVCLVTQLMHCSSLAQVLTPFALTPDAKNRFARDIAASGMAFLHAHRLVHRNLKPTNILVASRDVASSRVLCQIADFGAARFVADAHAAATMSSTAASPRYAAPEMLAAHPTFSYGIVLAALWNEGPPYAERALDTPFALVRLVRAGTRPALRADCPPGLRRPRTGVLGRGPRGTAHLRLDCRPTQLSCFRFQPARSARCS